MQTCNVCNKFQPIENFEFYYLKSYPEKRRKTCKSCRNEKRNKLDCRTPDSTRKSRLRKYGLTIEKYERLLKKQNNVCMICKGSNENLRWNGRLAIDHCHKTGKVRGLLCDKCNKGLGQFNDDITLFKEAIKYLRKNQG